MRSENMAVKLPYLEAVNRKSWSPDPW